MLLLKKGISLCLPTFYPTKLNGIFSSVTRVVELRLAHCLTLDKKDQDQYLHWRIAPMGARGIQESEIIQKI